VCWCALVPSDFVVVSQIDLVGDAGLLLKLFDPANVVATVSSDTQPAKLCTVSAPPPSPSLPSPFSAAPARSQLSATCLLGSACRTHLAALPLHARSGILAVK
jgi:hypothetical protein